MPVYKFGDYGTSPRYGWIEINEHPEFYEWIDAICLDDIKYTFKTITPILSVTIIAFLLIMLQPDFGSGVVLTMSIIGLIFSSGADFSFFLKIGIVGIIGVVGLIIVAPYRVARIVSFLNPWSDPLGSGFQIIQSLYAIGPGGLFGKGLGNSIQKHFYLPEPQTDFIFSTNVSTDTLFSSPSIVNASKKPLFILINDLQNYFIQNQILRIS